MTFIRMKAIADNEASRRIYFECVKVMRKQKRMSILSLPPDILLKVFALCDRNHLAENVRLVNRHFNAVATLVLSSDLFVLLNNYETASRTVAANPTLAKEFATVQNEIVYAVTWRYVWFLGESYTCFYGGRLLDMFWDILSDYKASGSCNTDITKLQKLNKNFCHHFETFKEPSLTNGHFADAGSKMIDLLECILDKNMHGTFNMISSSPEMVHFEAVYNVSSSWFSCLDQTIKQSATMKITEQHRNLLAAIRNLVMSCNTRHLQKLHAAKTSRTVTTAFYGSRFPIKQTTVPLRGQMKINVKCPPRLVPLKVYQQMRHADILNMTANRGRKRRFKLRLDMKHGSQHASWTLSAKQSKKRR